MSLRDSSSRKAAGVVLVVTVVLGLAVVGASGGRSWELESRFPNLLPSGTRSTTTTIAENGEATPPSQEWEFPDLSLVGWISLVIIVALIIWALYRTWKVLRFRFSRSGFSGAPGPIIAEPLEELPVLRKGVDAAQGLLEEISDTDDAIIAAWLALEDAAASTGVRRRLSQTPTEFTVAVLESTDADAESTQGLLRLYERARFSNHRSTQSDVEAASSYLRRLAAAWSPRVGVGARDDRG